MHFQDENYGLSRWTCKNPRKDEGSWPLKPYRECGCMLSADASAYPQCGARQMSATEEVWACLCLLGIIIFILASLSSSFMKVFMYEDPPLS